MHPLNALDFKYLSVTFKCKEVATCFDWSGYWMTHKCGVVGSNTKAK